MSIARKILLLALTALAAMAFAASTASAQETLVEFENEAGENCDPCLLHIVGESLLRDRQQPGAPVVSGCIDEFNVTLYHDTTGEVEWHGEDHPDIIIGCQTTNCMANPAEAHWPISAVGETGTDTLHMMVRFCLNNGHCNGEVAVAEIDLHLYEFSMHQLCFGGAREIEGHWETETDPDTGENIEDFEIDHTPDE